MFTATIGSEVATPLAVTLTVDLQDTGGNTWSYDLPITIYTESVIEGLVTDAGNGAPMPGATITYDGTVSGSVQTGSNGRYTFTVIDGTYALTASFPGYLTAGPRNETVPPSRSKVDFSLGIPAVVVDTTPLEITLAEGAATSLTLPVGNSGTAPLTYQLAASAPDWQPDGLWHESTRRAYTGTSSWYYGREAEGNYDTGARNFGALISSPILLPPSASQLTFHEFLEKEDLTQYDRATFSLSTDDGATWTQLRESQKTDGFVPATVSIGSYAGQIVRLRCHFDTIDSISNGHEGWYVDAFELDDRPLDWIGASAPVGVVNPGASEEATITVDATGIPAGTYQTEVALISDDPSLPDVRVPVNLTVTPGARLALEPTTLAAVVCEGQSRTYPVTIRNIGIGTLSWSVTSSTDVEHVEPPSSDTGQPFVWNDIASAGTSLAFGDDTNLGPFSLGFDFPFFGRTYDSVRICSNGFLSFTSTSAAFSNQPLTSSSAPDNLIAFLWDDLTFSNSGTAHYHRPDAETFVVQFTSVPYFGSSSTTFTGQVVLKASGDVFVYYNSVGRKTSATVGIRGESDEEVLQLAYNEAFVVDSSGLRMDSGQTLPIARLSGTLSGSATSETDAFQVEFDASSLTPGSYTSTISLSSSDATLPDRFTLPVELIVVPPNTYDCWSTQQSLAAKDTIYSLDPDGDGMINLLEFAFDANPANPASFSSGQSLLPFLGSIDPGTPTAQPLASTVTFVYRRRLDAATTGLNYRILESTDLVRWDPATVLSESTQASSDGGGTETVTATLQSNPLDPKAFYRLEVTLSP